MKFDLKRLWNRFNHLEDDSNLSYDEDIISGSYDFDDFVEEIRTDYETRAFLHDDAEEATDIE